MPKKIQPEMFERFLAVFSDMIDAYGVAHDLDVSHAVKMLEKALQRRIFNDNNNPIKKRMTPRRMFIAIYKQRFLVLEGIQYDMQIDASKHRMIDQFIEKLGEHDISLEDYLEWMFEEFFSSRRGENMRPPNIGYMVSTSAFQQYWSKNRWKIEKNKEANRLAVEEADLLSRSRVIARTLDDKNFLQCANNYRDGAIMIEEFRTIVLDAERQLGLK